MISSAIVGGICPIAVGLAFASKQRNSNDRVHCFVGDMAALGGMFTECQRYAERHNLPIQFVVEDNGISVCTDTLEAWGKLTTWSKSFGRTGGNGGVRRYQYKLPWPHAGAGKRVQF